MLQKYVVVYKTCIVAQVYILSFLQLHAYPIAPHTQAMCLALLYYTALTQTEGRTLKIRENTQVFSLFLLLFIRNEIISSCVCRALAAFLRPPRATFASLSFSLIAKV